MARLPSRQALGSVSVLLIGALFQGCALVGETTPETPTPPARPVPEAPENWTETGIASWYGEPFHGRITASGETYDMDRLTAAHPTLPFGTRILVENLDNGRTVTLRVNDRGPFVKDRILDVSRRAARELEMLGPGTARVRVTVVGTRGSAPPGLHRPVPQNLLALDLPETVVQVDGHTHVVGHDANQVPEAGAPI